MRYLPLLAGLWCAVRASDLVAGGGKPFVLYLVVQNNTGKPVDVTKLNTTLSIDGKAMANWREVLAKGAEPAWRDVPNGKYLPFGVDLSQQVARPGHHTLKLSGDCSSNEARVLTQK
jgi:hypothetical protein